jgi:hypothetical protein
MRLKCEEPPINRNQSNTDEYREKSNLLKVTIALRNDNLVGRTLLSVEQTTGACRDCLIILEGTTTEECIATRGTQFEKS